MKKEKPMFPIIVSTPSVKVVVETPEQARIARKLVLYEWIGNLPDESLAKTYKVLKEATC